MPSPSAIWVCDRLSCWRMRRKRGPTNSFFPDSEGIGDLLAMAASSDHLAPLAGRGRSRGASGEGAIHDCKSATRPLTPTPSPQEPAGGEGSRLESDDMA